MVDRFEIGVVMLEFARLSVVIFKFFVVIVGVVLAYDVFVTGTVVMPVLDVAVVVNNPIVIVPVAMFALVVRLVAAVVGFTFVPVVSIERQMLTQDSITVRANSKEKL